MMERLANFINGEFVEPLTGDYLENVDPATGMPYSLVPDSGAADVDRAVEAARDAFPAWSRTAAAERSRLLLRIADLIERDMGRLAEAECVDTGKPISLARTLDIPRAAANFRFFATAILHFRSECHVTDYTALNYTLRRPRGVAGVISPWNLPLYLLSWKAAPALATGNSVVAKPSELTPMTAYMLSRICQEAGLPPGVLNVVHGRGPLAGARLVRHPEVPTISFTGGTVTGAEIAGAAGPLFKKIALELGGKNPNVVLADADMDACLEGSLRSSFSNQGQVCLSGSRIFVDAPAYTSFVERFIEKTKEWRVGDPLHPAVRQGAIVSRRQLDKIAGYIEMARREGGTIRCGGKRPAALPERCKNGFFLEPTVITDLPADSRVNREEIFGPVVTITPFESTEQVVAFANATDYGLSASVWTSDVNRAHALAERIQAGTVWVNCWLLRDLRVPFGGMKSSGVGREGGEEALRFFTEPKNVCIRTMNQGD